jgi:signal peptidase I
MKRRTKISVGLAIVAAGLFLLTRFVVSPHVVFGDSMEPTLRSWDVCLMRRTHSYRPVRGEVVMFRTADDPPLYFVKRVVGLPGETVVIRHGVIAVNGTPLEKPRLDLSWELEPTTLPEGKILVAADNPEYGYGIVATRLVKARLVWQLRWKR